MNVLHKAIKRWYEGRAIARVTSGVWLWEAPPNKKRPYTIFETFTVPEETMHPGVDFEIVDITFYILSAEQSPEEAGDLYLSFITEMDATTDLGVAGFDTVRVDRTDSELRPDPDGGWIYEVSYSIELCRR